MKGFYYDFKTSIRYDDPWSGFDPYRLLRIPPATKAELIRGVLAWIAERPDVAERLNQLIERAKELQPQAFKRRRQKTRG